MSQYKQYIGDSVYADWDGDRIILTTENGFGPSSNTIYLEAEVYDSLKEYVDGLAKKLSKEAQ